MNGILCLGGDGTFIDRHNRIEDMWQIRCPSVWGGRAFRVVAGKQNKVNTSIKGRATQQDNISALWQRNILIDWLY